MSQTNFSSLPLSAEQLSVLETMQFAEMTAIQAKSLPLILSGQDVIAQAKTGSGKTAAFGLGLLHHLDPTHFKTQSLVLCPTRELADQVCKSLRELARAVPNTKITTLCGGKPLGPQFASLERAPHIVVGTPGRVLKHLEKGSLKLAELQILVLDEADRMLDMGFADDIKRIISFTPSSRQTLLFSATYPDEIKQISQSVQQSPTDIRVEVKHQKNNIEQRFFEVANDERANALVSLLNHYQPQACVIFCNRKNQCEELAKMLAQHGISAKTLHGDLEQNDRDRVLAQFSNNSCSILIATDVAARGLDIKELPMVINYELSHDPEVHIHRIGRTGRAGNKGIALSLLQPSEAHKLIAIENLLGHDAEMGDLSRLNTDQKYKVSPPMATLCIAGGRKDKLRPGDILGALTADKSIAGDKIGKIDRFENLTYVAVERSISDKALDLLSKGKIKGRPFKVRRAN